MTQTGNAPQNDPVLERARFRDWVNRIVASLRAANGWTNEEIAKRGQLSVETLYSWKKKGDTWPDGKPKPKTVEKFCTNLGIELFEPYEILGWTRHSVREPQPIMPELSRDLARFQLDPNVDPDEKRGIELVIARILAPYRRRK